MRFLSLWFIVVIISCDLGNKEFTRKKLSDGNIKIKWFYYSYITDNSPEFIVVEKDGISKKIYEADHVITNIFLKEHRIIIKVVKPKPDLVYTQDVLKEVFGYEIVFDSTGTYQELYSDPNKVK